MSRLTFEGDTTMLFGAALPTPRIESVKILTLNDSELATVSNKARDLVGLHPEAHAASSSPDTYDVIRASGRSPTSELEDDLWYESNRDNPEVTTAANYNFAKAWNKLEIELSFLFNSADTFSPDTLMRELFDYQASSDSAVSKPPLWINLFFIRDKTKIQKLKEDKSYLSEIREMILNYTHNRSDKFYDDFSTVSDPERFGLGLDTPSFSAAPAVYTVSVNQQPMNEFYTNVQITPYEDSEGNTVYKVSGIKLSLYVRSMDYMQDATIFAAVSTEDIQSMKSFSKPMLSMNFSDITYEDYMKDGRFAAFGDPVYVGADNIPCVGLPIRAFDGKYYKTDTYGFDQIYSELQSLVEPYLSKQPGNQILRLCIEGIISTALMYRKDVRLLEKLNAYQRFWPGTGQMDNEPAYSLLMSYEIKLNNFNAQLRDQGEVFKKIYRNFKFMDLRIRPPLNLDPSSWDCIPGSGGVLDIQNAAAADYIPPKMFHTAMAKFQPIAAATNDSMRAEIPFTEEERDEAFNTALDEILGNIDRAVLSTFSTFDSYADGGDLFDSEFEAIVADMSAFMWNITSYWVPENRTRVKYYNKASYTKGEINDLNFDALKAVDGCGEKCKNRSKARITQTCYWFKTETNGKAVGPPFELCVPKLTHESWLTSDAMSGRGNLGTGLDEIDYVDSDIVIRGDDGSASTAVGDNNTDMVRLRDINPFDVTAGYDGNTDKVFFLCLTKNMNDINYYKQTFKNVILEYLGMDINDSIVNTDNENRNAHRFGSMYYEADQNRAEIATFNEVVYFLIEQAANGVVSELRSRMSEIQEQADTILAEGDFTTGSHIDDIFRDNVLTEAGRDKLTNYLMKMIFGFRADSPNAHHLGTDNLLGKRIEEIKDRNPFNFFIRSNPRKDNFPHYPPITEIIQTYSSNTSTAYDTSLVGRGLGGAAPTYAAVNVYPHALAVVSDTGGDADDIVRQAARAIAAGDPTESGMYRTGGYRTDEGSSGIDIEEGSGKTIPPKLLGHWNFGIIIANAIRDAFFEARYQFQEYIRDFVDLVIENAIFKMDSGMFKALNQVDILVKKGGYFFCDVEKFIRRKSFMSRYTNVDAMLLTMPFAYEMTNMGVGIKEVSVAVTPDSDSTQALGIEGVGADSIPGITGYIGNSQHYSSGFEPASSYVTNADYAMGFNDVGVTPPSTNTSMELRIADCEPHVPYIYSDVTFKTQKKTFLDLSDYGSEPFGAPENIDIDIQYYGYCSPYNGIATFNDLFISDNEYAYLQELGAVDGLGQYGGASLTQQILDGEGNEILAGLLASPMTGLEPEDQYSMLLPRAYNFPQYDNRALPGQQTWRGNYRLAMFQYQYFMDDDDAFAWSYLPFEGGRPKDDKVIDPLTYSFTVRDHSFYVLMGLFDEYLQTYENFYENYYLKAHEYCSYDDFSGKFNDFFVEGITTEYPDALTQPWYRMVTTYIYFLEIFSRTYGGNRSMMLEAAENLLATIRPETGYLDALDEFEVECRRMNDLLETRRTAAFEAWKVESGMTDAEINVHLDMTDSVVTKEINGTDTVISRDVTHITTMYDHVGDYSALDFGSSHSDVLQPDATADDRDD